MNKRELAQEVADRSGYQISQIADVIDHIERVISDALAGGNTVTLRDVGTFDCVDKEARTARNPATGAEVKVAAKRVVKFRPSSSLKAAVNRR